MLISTYQERQTRNREKIKQLLNFLKEGKRRLSTVWQILKFLRE
ncbi:hypothetical protein AZ024_001764 [Escherichia coli]|nr:hypothetical protein AZ024_001764 [Escherichia coli]